jgi:hypothetical protein
LPDGLFSNQKYQFGYILEDLGMENVGLFYDHLEYFTAIWYISLQFGIVSGHLVYFSCFGTFGPGKIWQPCYEPPPRYRPVERVGLFLGPSPSARFYLLKS